MRRPIPLRLLLLLVTALTVSVLPLSADEPTTEPECYYKEFDEDGNPIGPKFCKQDVWFHQAETKVGNLAAAGHGKFPSWDTSKPTNSVTKGAGGGYFGNGTPRQQNGVSDPMFGARFEGAFTGNIDNLAVTMYLFVPGRQNEKTYYAGIDLYVDGQEILRIDQDGFPLTPGGNAVLKTDFTITGIHEAMKALEMNTGDDVQHTMHLFLTPYPLASQTSVYVYDTTEVPSGMTFNVPGDLEGRFVIPAWEPLVES